MTSQTTITELDIGEVETVLDRVEQELGAETVRPLRLLLAWCLSIHAQLQQKNASIARLRRMVFGPRTEKTRDVVPERDTQQTSEEHSTATPSAPDSMPPPSTNEPPKRKRPKKGHGRIPASAYTGCERVMITHETLCPGDSCPHCQDGTMYRQAEWAMAIRLTGQAPIGGLRYEMERLRCGLCGKVETAPLPENAGPDKYDPSVASVIGYFRYGAGMPWSRIERMQRNAGIPLPASVQWELVRDALPRGIFASYQRLLWEAAQGELFHNDDTHMQVLELTTKKKNGEPIREDAPERKAVFTTGILSVSELRPQIALFFTGPNHSGENLRKVLQQRTAELSTPLQMCDGLSHNEPGELRTIMANCLSHGRRKFVEVAETFPEEVRYVLDCFRRVYRTDAAAKRFRLTPELRLRLHQRRSESVMTRLRGWLTEQFEQRKVEPNSSLGQAIKYLRNRWEKLTLFLRIPGIPLDNNIAERALKMAIRHRRNSLFYRTQRGADVGDIYMSLIHTCYFAGADPIDYLTELQRNASRVQEDPSEWLPWNYREQLAAK